MLRKLWKDEAGTVALEYLLVATIASLSLVVGLNAVSRALNTELTELAQAIVSIDHTYAYQGYSTCNGSHNGSASNDADGVVESGESTKTAANGTTDFCSGSSAP